jgi:hypothetical protein
MLRVLLVMAALLAGLQAGQAGDDDFYAIAPSQIPGPPGSLIRLQGRPDIAVTRSFAWRIVYRSVSFDGRPIAVSATVLVLFGKPPEGGWPVIAWAHGTTGIVPKCGPSKRRSAGAFSASPVITERYVIVTTD